MGKIKATPMDDHSCTTARIDTEMGQEAPEVVVNALQATEPVCDDDI